MVDYQALNDTVAVTIARQVHWRDPSATGIILTCESSDGKRFVCTLKVRSKGSVRHARFRMSLYGGHHRTRMVGYHGWVSYGNRHYVRLQSLKG